MTSLIHTTFRLAAATVGAALCIAVAAAPAAAAPTAVAADAPRSEKVHYGDLNLANPADRKRFESRLRAAARRVCDQGGVTSAERAEEMRCVRMTFEATAPQRLAAMPDPIG